MADEMIEPQEGSEGRLVADIDGKEFHVHDPVISGRQVLEIAGRHPVDDFIVYWLGKDNVLEDLGLERTVHLHKHRVACFFTFESDRSYRFEFEGKREDWGAPKITEETLRKIGAIGPEFRIFLARPDGPRLIKRGEVVNLAEPGIERFFAERAIIVRVENEENGEFVELEGFNQTKLSTLFVEMYEKFHVQRQTDDRLQCEGGGDVFPFAEMTLGEYIEKGHCKCLVWLFCGGTGGASCPS
jgi:hypothetical protein